MSTPFKKMAQLNKLIHEPARLAVMSALYSLSLAEFLQLLQLTGLTKGNLSSHLSKLEKAGYIQIEKQFVRKKIPHTTVRITHEGKIAMELYWKHLSSVLEETKNWVMTTS